MTPTTQTARGAKAVQTAGEGKRTTAHLNLTVDMAGQVESEVEQKERFCSMRRQPAPRVRIQGSPL